jgi:catechol 2,3-dioxygenase-like lactoylglutathione lyase family enzyme
MIVLDHTILRVRDVTRSVAFYAQVLGFVHEGRLGPFDVMRVNDTFTLDLRQSDALHSEHLAFSLDRALFDAIHARIVERGIAFGGSPFDRRNGMVGHSVGARGMAQAIYFDDPDGHALEIRVYPERADIA